MKKVLTLAQVSKLMEAYRAIAGEAIELADAYSGGDSDTVESLNKRFEKLEEKR